MFKRDTWSFRFGFCESGGYQESWDFSFVLLKYGEYESYRDSFQIDNGRVFKNGTSLYWTRARVHDSSSDVNSHYGLNKPLIADAIFRLNRFERNNHRRCHTQRTALYSTWSSYRYCTSDIRQRYARIINNTPRAAYPSIKYLHDRPKKKPQHKSVLCLFSNLFLPFFCCLWSFFFLFFLNWPKNFSLKRIAGIIRLFTRATSVVRALFAFTSTCYSSGSSL